MASAPSNGTDDDSDDDEKMKAEINVVRNLMQLSSDGSPLVRSEVAIGMRTRKIYYISQIEWSF